MGNVQCPEINKNNLCKSVKKCKVPSFQKNDQIYMRNLESVTTRTIIHRLRKEGQRH